MLERTVEQQLGEGLLAAYLVDRSELEFRRLLEKLPAGAYMCDADGLITYFNERAVEVWGRAPKLNDPEDRFCGSFKLFATDGSPLQHDQCWMALALRDNVAHNGCEIVVERPDGRRHTVLAHANPIHDDFGRLLGAVNVLVDITDRKRAEEALRQARDELELRVAERTAALAASNERLQRLSQLILEAEEEERKRLSRDLHDSVGQLTTALLINLSLLQDNLPGGDGQLPADIEAVREVAYKIHDGLRSVSHMLRPPELEMLGLNEALRQLCQEFSKLTGQSIVYRGAAVPPLPDSVTVTFYRFVQEAVNNAVKHAQASAIEVVLQRQENQLSVTVADDGVGFDVSANVNTFRNGGVGLVSMRERLEMLEGQMEIDSAPGRGARLSASSYIRQEQLHGAHGEDPETHREIREKNP